MEDKPKSKRGGARRKGAKQTPVPYKMDNDLFDWLKDYEGETRNRFINVAVRERVERLQSTLDMVNKLSNEDGALS